MMWVLIAIVVAFLLWKLVYSGDKKKHDNNVSEESFSVETRTKTEEQIDFNDWM